MFRRGSYGVGGSARDGLRAVRTSRRELLCGAAASVGGLALPGFASVAFAQDSAPSAASGPFTVTSLANGMTLLAGASNMLAQTTPEGLVLVDTGTAAGRAQLQGWLVEHGADRVAAIFNTHWHPEQVGANEALGAAGARIFAHEKTRQRLHSGYYRPEEDRYVAPLAASGLPTETFYDSGTTTIGGSRIDYGYLIEAHTDGDIYIAFPAQNVIAVGDVVSPVRDPVFDWFGGGWLGGRLDGLLKLIEIGDTATLYVPAYGPAVDRAALQSEHDMLLQLFDRFVEHIRLGETARDMLEAGIHEGLGREFTDPSRLIRDCYEGFWAHHNTLMHDIV